MLVQELTKQRKIENFSFLTKMMMAQEMVVEIKSLALDNQEILKEKEVTPRRNRKLILNPEIMRM